MNALQSLATCIVTLKCNKHLSDTVWFMISISDRKGFLEWRLFQLKRSYYCPFSLHRRTLRSSLWTTMMSYPSLLILLGPVTIPFLKKSKVQRSAIYLNHIGMRLTPFLHRLDLRSKTSQESTKKPNLLRRVIRSRKLELRNHCSHKAT